MFLTANKEPLKLLKICLVVNFKVLSADKKKTKGSGISQGARNLSWMIGDQKKSGTINGCLSNYVVYSYTFSLVSYFPN